MSSERDIKMWTPNTVVLFLLILVGGAVAFYRMAKGLGASTNMNDVYPWGFWLGFDVLGGVAMAAGGFIIAAAVYLFNWKKYKPIARPAVLTAFLGYLMAIIALFLDIGHPFRLWHPSIMWQVHSVMWIVAIHVILYTTTLALEASPMFFERFGMKNALTAVNKMMVGAVVFGVMLSTLHQSSLGAVFLIAPARMSPLWFNSMLPYLFLLSCIPMGMAMVSTESMLSAKAFKHDIDKEIYYGLARGTLISLVIYLVIKLFFLFKDAGIGAIFDGSLEANMYIVEMAVGVVIPILILASRKNRTNLKSIFAVNILVIVGVLVNRLNVCVFSMQSYTSSKGAAYFPSLMEFLITLGVIALGVFLFKMAAKHLPLFAKA
ncbi:MAG: Ni/Fe-hydrogenase cytochrome b subunit [Deltaproteobacteria bacterium]|nr:Ni/Fe-hydrogenase cytochrome b subunit [Deltaproteobacteria bacterium]